MRVGLTVTVWLANGYCGSDGLIVGPEKGERVAPEEGTLLGAWGRIPFLCKSGGLCTAVCVDDVGASGG